MKEVEISKTLENVGNWRAEEWPGRVIAGRGKRGSGKMICPPECW